MSLPRNLCLCLDDDASRREKAALGGCIPVEDQSYRSFEEILKSPEKANRCFVSYLTGLPLDEDRGFPISPLFWILIFVSFGALLCQSTKQSGEKEVVTEAPEYKRVEEQVSVEDEENHLEIQKLQKEERSKVPAEAPCTK